MTFNINFPLPPGIPSVDVTQFQVNWAKLNSDFLIDHTAFTAATNSGFHKKVTFSDVALDPALNALRYPLSLLYTKHDGGATTTDLFFAAQNAGATTVKIRQLTDLPITTVANTGSAGGNISYIDTSWGFRFLWGLTNAFAGLATIVVPALSGTFMSYSLTPNAAPGSTFGCVVQNATTLTAGNTNNQQLRYFIIMQLP